MGSTAFSIFHLRFSIFHLQLGLDSGLVQRRHGSAVIASYVETFTPIGHRASQNGFPRTVIIARVGLGWFGARLAFKRNQIEHCGGESLNSAALLMRHVPRHR